MSVRVPRSRFAVWEPDATTLVELATPVRHGWRVDPLGGIEYALVDVGRAHPTRWGRAARRGAPPRPYAPGWWIFLGVPVPPRGQQQLYFRRERFVQSAATPAGWLDVGDLPRSYGGLPGIKRGEVDPFTRGVTWLPTRGGEAPEPPPEDEFVIDLHMLPRAEALLRELMATGAPGRPR